MRLVNWALAAVIAVLADISAFGQIPGFPQAVFQNVLASRGTTLEDPLLVRAGLRARVGRTTECTLTVEVAQVSAQRQTAQAHPVLLVAGGQQLLPSSNANGVSCWTAPETELAGSTLLVTVLGASAANELALPEGSGGVTTTSDPGVKFWAGLPPVAAWVIWALCLAVVAVLIWRHSKYAAKATHTGSIASIEDQDWLSHVLPIVRVRKNAWFGLPGMKRDELIAVFPGQLVQMRKRRRATVDAAFEPDGEAKLGDAKGARVRRRLALESVTQVEVERVTILNRVGIRFRAGKNSLRTVVLERELSNLLRALQLLLPGRVVTDCRITFNPGVVGTAILILMSTSIALTLIGYVLGLALLTVFVFVAVWMLLVHVPKPRWRIERAQRAAQDLSKRRPFRSRTLSLAVKLTGVILLFLFIVRWRNAVPEEWSGLMWIAAFFVFANLVQIANSLWQRDPAKLRGGAAGRPILYLRSFLDDRETTLNPGTMMSALLGLDPPLYRIDSLQDTPIYPLLRRFIKYFANFHPLRLLKLLFNRQQDSSEEQMAAFFKRYGAFVAIGKPGERFATTGAARMYVGNDEWQGIVQAMLAESQVVLLQPASTEGIWWEVERSIRTVQPQCLLFCMVDYRDRQNDYESFRLRLEKLLPDARVPRGIGCKRHISFFRFEKDWQPVELPLVYHWRLAWPFRNRAVNFRRTLKPFLVAAGVIDERGKPAAFARTATA